LRRGGAPALAQGDAARVAKDVPQADVAILASMVAIASLARDHGHVA
jgi:hypothetical protein